MKTPKLHGGEDLSVPMAFRPSVSQMRPASVSGSMLPIALMTSCLVRMHRADSKRHCLLHDDGDKAGQCVMARYSTVYISVIVIHSLATRTNALPALIESTVQSQVHSTDVRK